MNYVHSTATLPKGYNYPFIRRQAELLAEGKVLIHASAVEQDGFATVYCGESYSGKTHRALERCKRGARLLGDDFVVLSKGRVEPFITPIHMKQSYGYHVPLKYAPKRALFWAIRAFTRKRPFIEVPAQELGIQTGKAATIGSIEVLGNPNGWSMAEKIYNVTLRECGFSECEFKAKMRETIARGLKG